MDAKEIIKKIRDKKFDSVINGYSSSGVDHFLDSVIIDIEELQNQNEEQKKQLNKKDEEIKELKKEKNKLEDQIKQLQKQLNDLYGDYNEEE